MFLGEYFPSQIPLERAPFILRTFRPRFLEVHLLAAVIRGSLSLSISFPSVRPADPDEKTLMTMTTF